MNRNEAMKALEQARGWAKDKLAAGQEPPWSWYQLMKLVEAADAILAGMDATKENLPLSEQPAEKHLRLVGSTDPQDSAQPRPAGLPIQLPM